MEVVAWHVCNRHTTIIDDIQTPSRILRRPTSPARLDLAPSPRASHEMPAGSRRQQAVGKQGSQGRGLHQLHPLLFPARALGVRASGAQARQSSLFHCRAIFTLTIFNSARNVKAKISICALHTHTQYGVASGAPAFCPGCKLPSSRPHLEGDVPLRTWGPGSECVPVCVCVGVWW